VSHARFREKVRVPLSRDESTITVVLLWCPQIDEFRGHSSEVASGHPEVKTMIRLQTEATVTCCNIPYVAPGLTVSATMSTNALSPLPPKARPDMWHYFFTLCLLAFGNNLIAAEPMFDQQIAPLIARRCLSCHSGNEPKGKLDLSTRTSATKGGESGSAVVPGKLGESLLWEYVDSDEMPPKKPLPAAEKALLKKWIASGAKWGTEKIDPFRFTTDARAGYDWWSLKPLANLESKRSIDSFIDARLTTAGLSSSAVAGKRTLIRRLSFDLLGLPPTREQIGKFLADKSDEAYEKLVDRLLASPHYGERWARHWLDVVRFGESNGFEYDQPRDNAWHYRNWVINALNQDMPYDEFVRLQLAGDILRPKDPQAIAAAGFLVAGAHNTTLPSSKKMRMTMAQDELEDLVGVVGQTFLGLTVNCSRCHDHKFDPISQKEYYQFAATLSGVTHGERTVQPTTTPEQQRRIAAIDSSMAKFRKELKEIDKPIRVRILAERKAGRYSGPQPPKAFATWEFDNDLKDRHGTLHAKAVGGAKRVDGFLNLDGKSAYAETAPLPVAIGEKTLEAWVQLNKLDQRGGGVISLQTTNGAVFDAIVFGERESRKWLAGSNSFKRTKSFGGPAEQQATTRAVHMAIVYRKDGTITAYRDGKPYGKSYRPGPLQSYAAGEAQIVFGIRHGPAGANKMLAGRIQRAQFYDRALTADEVAASAGVANNDYVPESQILERLSTSARKTRDQLSTKIKRAEREKASFITTPQKIYTCVSRKPGVTKLLRRGNVADPAEAVSPAGLQAIPGILPDFRLAPNASDADRRKKLAEWITHRDNPLFARVIVNRLWHYHFGQGLVTTPSDFGYNGSRPSHPDLLDGLAQSLRQHDYRLKPIHRLIVTSATYRQSSKPNTAAAKLDAGNRLLWRKSPQRLEAEAIRDAVLLVAGQLDRQIGGRGYRDVRHFSFKGSNFYEPLAETGSQSRRRTIYRFSPRGGRNPFLDTFDCPDPSTTAPQRASTTTPLQALVLMHNALIFQMADQFAQRITREAGKDVEKQSALTFQSAYGRTADADEIQLASRFVKKHGLPALCRVVFNSNEFVFIE